MKKILITLLIIFLTIPIHSQIKLRFEGNQVTYMIPEKKMETITHWAYQGIKCDSLYKSNVKNLEDSFKKLNEEYQRVLLYNEFLKKEYDILREKYILLLQKQ